MKKKWRPWFYEGSQTIRVMLNNSQAVDRYVGKYYFGIGIEKDLCTIDRRYFFFYLYKVIAYPENNEMPQRGKHYKGFNLSATLYFPCFGIKL